MFSALTKSSFYSDNSASFHCVGVCAICYIYAKGNLNIFAISAMLSFCVCFFLTSSQNNAEEKETFFLSLFSRKYRFNGALFFVYMHEEDNGNSTAERRYTWLLSLHSTFSIRFEKRSFSFFIFFLFYFLQRQASTRRRVFWFVHLRVREWRMNRFFLITLFVSFLSSFILEYFGE